MPNQFSLVGGEPTLHPKLSEFVELTRKYWPYSHIRLVTNGFFLHRHPRLPEVLRDDPNARLYVSVHHNSPAYIEKLKPINALLKSWIADYGIQVKGYRSFQWWTQRYHGYGDKIKWNPLTTTNLEKVGKIVRQGIVRSFIKARYGSVVHLHI